MPKQPGYHLLIRVRPETPYVSVWLRRRDGPALSGLLFGECLLAQAEALAVATGLHVIREESPLPGGEPLTPKGCVGPSEQLDLFTEES